CVETVPREPVAFGKRPPDRGPKAFDVAFLVVIARLSFVDGFGERTAVDPDDRRATRHRFERDQPLGFDRARESEDIERRIERGEFLAREKAEKANVGIEVRDRLFERFSSRAVAAENHSYIHPL